MAFAFFQIPTDANPEVAAPLNAFLRAHRVVRVTRQWCEAGRESAWAFCIEYLQRLDEELDALREQLANAQPHCGDCQTFTIYDPKERLITAPVFRERVLHHAVMNVCGPVLDRRLIHHSYACRKGKGTLAALQAARRAAGAAPWFLKLDVRKYFDSILHERLFAALARVFREETVQRLLAALVTAYRPGQTRGLAIGTLVSQHLANFYLAPLDTLVLQEIRPVGYVRYMDDLALWTAEGAAARQARDRLQRFASDALGLGFKTAFSNRTVRGMDFLGHRVFPHRLGVNRASRRRYGAKLRALQRDWESGVVDEAMAQTKATALTAFTDHADCLAWRRRVVSAMEARRAEEPRRTRMRQITKAGPSAKFVVRAPDTLGDGPQAGIACCAAAVGSTTAGTPDPPTATATTRTTATTTSVSAPAPAPADGRSALVEPARHPVPPPRAADETPTTRRWLVARRRRNASSESEQRVFLIPRP